MPRHARPEAAAVVERTLLRVSGQPHRVVAGAWEKPVAEEADVEGGGSISPRCANAVSAASVPATSARQFRSSSAGNA